MRSSDSRFPLALPTLLACAVAACGPPPDEKDDDVVVIEDCENPCADGEVCREGECIVEPSNNSSTNDNTATNGGPNGSNTNGGGNQQSEKLYCEGIFQCIVECETGDDTCTNGCYESGYPQSQQLFEVWVLCARDNGCLDVDTTEAFEQCLANSCPAETVGCAQDGPEEDVPPPTNAQTGNHPQELVGSWSEVGTTVGLYDPNTGSWGTPNGEGTYHLFGADGEWSSGFYMKAGSGTCVSEFMKIDNGTWYVDEQGNLVTVREEFRSNFTPCGSEWEEEHKTETYTTVWAWSIEQTANGNVLQMSNQNVSLRMSYDGPPP